MRAFRVAYDGAPYHGFQRQPDVPTVEDALFDALRDLDVLDGDAPPGYAAAGRTDAGVSALAQTVAFECPDWLTPRAFNGALPADVRAWASADADDEFHATADADYREYVYHLHAPAGRADEHADERAGAYDDDRAGGHATERASRHADLDRIRDALAVLEGTHDFHNLTADDGDTTRTLREASAVRDGEFLVLRFRADGFLRQLVRRVVSLVRAVGTGDAPRSKVERALAPDPLDGPEGVPPAPAPPLVLADVGYDLAFSVDDAAAESARAAFASLRGERLTGARVAADVVDGLDGE